MRWERLAADLGETHTNYPILAAFLALRDIADSRRIPYDPDPRPDAPLALTIEEFREGVRVAEDGGFRRERDVDDAWPDFKGWRVNYESLAYASARRHDAVPALWSGPRNWPAEPIPPNRPPHRQPGAPDVRFFPESAAYVEQVQKRGNR